MKWVRRVKTLLERGVQHSKPLRNEVENSITHVLQHIQKALNESGSQSAAAPARSAEQTKQGQFILRSFHCTAGMRAYKLYIPSSQSGGRDPGPLIVMLHGCTQSPDAFAIGTGMNALAEQHGFVVAYPAQDDASNPSRCWNWFRREDQRRGKGEPAIIAGLTRRIVEEFKLDASRVYIAGLSAGGAMAVTLGRTYPELYAAVGCHSGLAYGAAHGVASAFRAMRTGAENPIQSSRQEKVRAVPTIVFHGSDDERVNPQNGLDVVDQALGCRAIAYPHAINVRPGKSPDGRLYRQTIYLDAREESFVEHWTLEGVGHAWSGGSADGTHTDPGGVNASSEMVRFFLHHRLNTFS